METGGALRFTAAEGGARLAAAVRSRNTLAALAYEHATFVAGKLLQEDAYKIRGSLFDGSQRTVYITRTSRVACTSYELKILTDLSVSSATDYDDVFDWYAEVDKKEVLVLTSPVLRRLLEEEVLSMSNINVLIIDSCHTICEDVHLQRIMEIHSNQGTPDEPRILALTYPLFAQDGKAKANESINRTINNRVVRNFVAIEENSSTEEDISVPIETTQNDEIIESRINDVSQSLDILRIDDIIRENDTTKVILVKDNALFSNKVKIIEIEDVPAKELKESSKISDNHKTLDDIIDNNIGVEKSPEAADDEKSNKKGIDGNVAEILIHDNKLVDMEAEIVPEENPNEQNDTETVLDLTKVKTTSESSEYQEEIKEICSDLKEEIQNSGDFLLYEKLEWKVEELERKLCCTADLAEDIDGIKRLSTTVSKPRELILEYAGRPNDKVLPETYIELEKYMRDTVADVMHFLDEHRYDPTEMYGEFGEELTNKGVEDPTEVSKELFRQFIYVLDELGPYGADKAAYALVVKAEKLKVSIPYERHFLLLCLSVSVLLKIRCAADHVLQNYGTDWEKIEKFCTPKVHRFAEILKHFNPPGDCKGPRNSPSHRFRRNEDVKNKENANDAEDKTASNYAKIDKSAKNESNHTNVTNATTSLNAAHMLNELDKCDFMSLSNKIVDKVNTYEANLSEIHDITVIPSPLMNDLKVCDQKIIDSLENCKEQNLNVNVLDRNDPNVIDDKNQTVSTLDPKEIPVGPQGFPRRGPRNRGRGRQARFNHAARALQMQLNPDALCGVVFMNEPLMAKTLFILVVEMSRNHPELGFLCAQYTDMERSRMSDPTTNKKQEDVLKKFRMHECNLLLATSALEDGIDLPRCNLVLRWDSPASYRSFGLCRSRARAPRSACVLLSDATRGRNSVLIHHVATYKELDQMLSRKCGCGARDEPPQSEEDHADMYTKIITPYTPLDHTKNANIELESNIRKPTKCDDDHCKINSKTTGVVIIINGGVNDESDRTVCAEHSNDADNNIVKPVIEFFKEAPNKTVETGNEGLSKINHIDSDKVANAINTCDRTSNGFIKNTEGSKLKVKSGGNAADQSNDKCDNETIKDKNVCESELASVDLGSAISLINRYCGKLPSDTFTRLAPQWWIEEVYLPVPVATSWNKEEKQTRKAYICTLRLPLNCPVKYNIVGHPMPTRVLARRMVALQACRILHRSAELDNQLMPIGKENFKAPEFEYAPAPPGDAAVFAHSDHAQLTNAELAELARPGTTKRRQYYYKRTAWSFTDCQPVHEAVDAEDECSQNVTEEEPASARTVDEQPIKEVPQKGVQRNMLYAIVSRLWCALPERYNTRGRRLHVPQTARQGLGILTRREIKKIPAFPVYTRSGEVRVSVEHVSDADVRVTPRRGRLVRRFMRFVFAEVLRVRRRGMRLSTEGTHNNYYVVPTSRSIQDDGSVKIDIDWEFLELIYKHTEKRSTAIEKQVFWNHGEAGTDTLESYNGTRDDNDKNVGQNSEVNVRINDEIKPKSDELGKTDSVNDKNDHHNADGSTAEHHNAAGSKTEHHNADGSIAEHHNANGSITEHHNANGSITEHHNADGSIAEESKEDSTNAADNEPKKSIDNPLLKPGEIFVFDPEKYKEAVVTPWYRNQDQPQFFLVAEICWQLTPGSAFPSATHHSFKHYYTRKYGVQLTQSEQPLLDVDHTSARLNLLTPRYVNRKGVALPVSSERTRRAKRDRLDQKQILVPELCRVHPFAAPLWFATVALPCVLYRINALLIADEIRRSVAIDVGLGTADITERTRPGFEWPALDFGWSLAEVLKLDGEKVEREKKREDEQKRQESAGEREMETDAEPGPKEKTANEILQEAVEAESDFEVGLWNNDMASNVPDDDFDEMLEPLPPDMIFCNSASGGSNWPTDLPPRQTANKPHNPGRAFSMADSDCSFMSSEFDTDDSDLETDASDEDTDTGFCSRGMTSMGVRIEYKTPHEAEAIELAAVKKGTSGPQPDEEDDNRDKLLADAYLRSGEAPEEHLLRFRQSVEEHKKEIFEKGHLIRDDAPLTSVLPPTGKEIKEHATKIQNLNIHRAIKDAKMDIDNKTDESVDRDEINMASNVTIDNVESEHTCVEKSPTDLFKELFPYGTIDENELIQNGKISIDAIERSKRILLEQLRKSLTEEEVNKKSCFSMIDIDIDSPDYVNEKVANVGFDSREAYVEKLNKPAMDNNESNIDDVKDESNSKENFDFDYQPKLEGHPGPSPSVILQALTMSNANDGINLERLETIGDSFLKFAITAYLYCAQPTVHEGKLSHMRSKQVSNLNLYRLGRGKHLGARMIASKFEPHDNWLPPCHRAPATVSHTRQSMLDGPYWEQSYEDAEHEAACPLGDRRRPARPDDKCACRLDGQEGAGCFIPYNLITQHSIPDKSVADCVEALIGAYLIECGPRGALLFMSWLGIRVLPRYEVPLTDGPHLDKLRRCEGRERQPSTAKSPATDSPDPDTESECSGDEENGELFQECEEEEAMEPEDWSWPGRAVGTLRPYKNDKGQWIQPVFGELRAPPSPLLRYIQNPDQELGQMLSGYDELERTLRYRFRDRSLLLQAMTHASHHLNRLTDCYQRLEFLGDAILDYLITRHLYEDERRHSPGALTDLRSALVNNTIFATLAVRHGFHKYFRHMSPGLNEVLMRYVKIQEENGHSISEEHYLIQEDEMEQAEDVEVPKALGDLFESVAGAIFLDSGMSLGAVWNSYVGLMGTELEAFSAAAPKSPVRELLEAEPDTAKFGKPERLADGRRVRVCVEVFGRGTFKGIGRNYRIAKGTAARCALRHLKRGYRPA